MRTKVAKNSSGGRGRTSPIPTCRPRLRIIGCRPICTTRTANLNWAKFSPVGGRPCWPSRMWAQRPLAARRNRLLYLHLAIPTGQAFWHTHVKPRPVAKGGCGRRCCRRFIYQYIAAKRSLCIQAKRWQRVEMRPTLQAEWKWWLPRLLTAVVCAVTVGLAQTASMCLRVDCKSSTAAESSATRQVGFAPIAGRAT